MSQPATYFDLQHALLMSRGIDPRTVGSKRASRGKPSLLRVVGGTASPAMRDLAETWASGNVQKDWQKNTDSTAAGIAWAISGD